VTEPTIFGQHDENTIQQMKQVSEHERVVATALMADGHLGYGMPIGGVVAYENAVSPEGVGYDIACGNKAVKTDLLVEDVRDDLPGVMDRIFSEVAFGVGQSSGLWKDHEVFDRDEWSIPLAKGLKQMAQQQLGSVGSGNHYVDLLADGKDRLWVGVHFGSRGLGHKIATNFMSGGDGDMMKPVTVIPLDSAEGEDYWPLMELAGAYASAGRDCVVQQVLDILGARSTFEVHNHHNYAWKETHFGREVVVVRKGATPAFPHQQGFVGGSMGDDAVILEGTITPTGFHAADQKFALYSTVHGAGRVMSRRAAKGKWKKGVQVSPGAISREDMDEWLGRRRVELRGADLDEAPQAYRRLPEVLEAQGETVRVNHTLRPIGVAMAGPRDWDPYKD
jgi:tRNA-splicing ligase RtcB